MRRSLSDDASRSPRGGRRCLDINTVQYTSACPRVRRRAPRDRTMGKMVLQVRELHGPRDPSRPARGAGDPSHICVVRLLCSPGEKVQRAVLGVRQTPSAQRSPADRGELKQIVEPSSRPCLLRNGGRDATNVFRDRVTEPGPLPSMITARDPTRNYGIHTSLSDRFCGSWFARTQRTRGRAPLRPGYALHSKPEHGGRIFRITRVLAAVSSPSAAPEMGPARSSGRFRSPAAARTDQRGAGRQSS